MKCFINDFFDKYREWATVPLRIVLAVIFIPAGYGKLTGLAGITGFFESLGIPLAGFFAVVVGIVELVGGITLLLGLATRHASLLLSIVMIVALLTAHLDGGYDKALLALGGSLSLLFTGAGKLSLDSKIFKKQE